MSEITNHLSLQLTLNHCAGLFPVASAKHQRLGTLKKKKRIVYLIRTSCLVSVGHFVAEGVTDGQDHMTHRKSNSERSDPQLLDLFVCFWKVRLGGN